ncbi:ANTAR domain-containing protein [Arthrobacter sp. MPF02]|uniref:ANTAR domain-containing protein n=1 Tax=Arthrobacter sp. MPF02 TaxID=3388492 RepID=UPI00398508E2
MNTDVSEGTVFADVAMYLQDLVLAEPDVGRLLDKVAAYAAARLGGSGGTLACTLRLTRPKKPVAVAASDSRARMLAQLEGKYGDGPATTAARSARTVAALDLGGEERWPEYVRSARRQGVLSVLSIPLDLEGGSDGVLTLYAGRPDAFGSEARAAAEAFVLQVSKGLALALRIARLQDTRDGLNAAMQSRTVIDLATGAIMAQNRCSQAEAFKVLREASNTRNMKLRDVASVVVTSVAGGSATFTYFDE